MTLEQLYKAKLVGRNIVVPQDLVGSTGILDTAQFIKSSHGLKDLVDVGAELPTGSFRRINGGMATSSLRSDLTEIDLFPFGTIYEVDARIVEDWPGGLQGYVKDKAKMYAPGLAASFESALIYGDDNGFKGLREIANDNSMATPINGSGTGNTYSSVIAVKWDPNLCGILYNEKEFKKGLFVPVILNGGKVVYVDVFDAAGAATGTKKPVYQWAIEQSFGIKTIGTTQVAVLTGLKDVTNYVPTTTALDTLLDSINADPTNTFLYMRRNIRSLVKRLKVANVTYAGNENDIGRTPLAYDTIKMIISSQITQTEARTVA